MPLFSVFKAQDGGPEWRLSNWRIIDPLRNGRECPRPGCKAGVFGGKSWRDHWAGHQAEDAQLAAMDQAIKDLAKGVRVLARELGYSHWYEDAEEPEEEPVVEGRVFGSGPLPPEMRMGE